MHYNHKIELFHCQDDSGMDTEVFFMIHLLLAIIYLAFISLGMAGHVP